MEFEAEVWVRDASDLEPTGIAWRRGQITHKDEAVITVQIEGSNETRSFDTSSAATADDVKLCNVRDSNHDGTAVDDLISLTHLHEPAILHSLQVRFNEDNIYTATGPILLAVNPFQRLPLYTKEVRVCGTVPLFVSHLFRLHSSSSSKPCISSWRRTTATVSWRRKE